MGPPIEDNTKLPVVDWKTFTLTAIQALREWAEIQFKGLREWVELHFELQDRATKLSIREVERRLDELNHAHAKAELDRSQFLPKPTFEGWKEAIEKRINLIEQTLAKAEGRATSQAVFVAAVVSIIISVVAGLIARFLAR